MDTFFQLRKVDEEKRLVYGRATQEVVDRSGEIMDYESSRPLIEAWSAETLDASRGLSKGNVRSQHRKDSTAGKVVELTFDDESKSVDMVVKVVDDGDWKKVTEGVYTGFSLGGSYAKKWTDPKLKTSLGSPVTRYTALPSEVSLVDRPCVQSATFFDVLKADGTTEQKQFTTQGEPMEEPKMEKGLWEAKGLISAIQDLKYLHDNIGEGGKIGPEIEEQIRQLGQLTLAYLAEELGEHIGHTVEDSMDIDAIIGRVEDTDIETDEDGEPISVEKGDFPGHPFRGNQHARGRGAGSHHGASRTAHLASVRAHKGGTKAEHRVASSYHRRAAAEHRKAGNSKMVAHHSSQAKYHSGAAGAGGQGIGKADGDLDLSKAAKTGQKAMRKELGETLAKCNDLHKAYLDTYTKEGAEKAEDIGDLEKADIGEMVRRAVSDAIGPALESMKKSNPVQVATTAQAPVLRVLDKAEDSTLQKSDGLEELRKAAESGDTLAAIKLAHVQPFIR